MSGAEAMSMHVLQVMPLHVHWKISIYTAPGTSVMQLQFQDGCSKALDLILIPNPYAEEQ